MTDTTDIKALRAETWDLHTMQDATEFADRLLDLLEAERQRAERGEAAAGIIQQMYNELKGDRVPVGLIEAGLPSVNEGEFVYVVRSKQFIPYGTSLFTSPQKPVVLPDEMREDILRCVDEAMTGCNSLSAPDYAVRVAGWLAAGGIVKDGK